MDYQFGDEGDGDDLMGPKLTYKAQDEWTFDIKLEVGIVQKKNLDANRGLKIF